jgi:hypothetical protein
MLGRKSKTIAPCWLLEIHYSRERLPPAGDGASGQVTMPRMNLQPNALSPKEVNLTQTPHALESLADRFSGSFSRVAKTLVASPIIVLIATGVRLLVISDYNTTTASTIVAEKGAAGTLLGTVIPLIPTTLPFITLLLLAFRRWLGFGLAIAATAFVSPAYATIEEARQASAARMRTTAPLIQQTATWVKVHASHFSMSGTWRNRVSIYHVASRGLLHAAHDPHWQAVGFGIFGFLLASRGRLHGRFRIRFRLRLKLLLRPWLVGFACFLAMAFVNVMYHIPHDLRSLDQAMRRPWIPAESITLKNGDRKVGYTLSIKDGWYVWLDEKSRSIEYLKPDDVQARQVCSVDQTGLPAAPIIRIPGAEPVLVASCAR